jgi:tetratricopeptide (TPR) repeat protein
MMKSSALCAAALVSALAVVWAGDPPGPSAAPPAPAKDAGAKTDALRQQLVEAGDVDIEPDKPSDPAPVAPAPAPGPTPAPARASAASAPPEPASPSLLPPDFVSQVTSATPEQLAGIATMVQSSLEKQDSRAQSEVMLAARAVVLAEERRREAATDSATRAGRAPIRMNDNSRALAQLLLCRDLSIEAREGADKGLARAAFEGGSREPTPDVVTPRRDRFFEGSFTAPPVRGGADLKTKAPPPPPTPMDTSAPKGVKIDFDARALEAAVGRGLELGELERRLAMGSVRELDAALTWADAEVSRRLVAERAVTGTSLVSFKAVVEAARDAPWEKLPEEVRFPGGLKRVHALVIAPERDDVLVIGSRDGPGEPIRLDDWSVAIECVLKGESPFCSLEPDVMPGGDQRAVVQGVPFDSHFALVMLEADYAMKRIILGAGLPRERAPPETLSSLLDASPDASFDLARFWFTPVPLGAGAIPTSRDGRAFVFDALVRVLTEDMARQGAALVGLGRQSGVADRAARSFSKELPRLEQEVPSFRELQSLFDVVLAASLLRARAADLPVLTALAKLPRASVAVPRTYPAIVTVTERAGIPLAGGVQMRETIPESSVVAVGGLDALASLKPGGAPPSTLPFARDGGVVSERDPLAEFAAAVRAGELRVADASLTRELERSPGEVMLRMARAAVRARRGLVRLALRDLAAARSGGADVATTRLLGLTFRLDAGEAVAVEAADRPTLASVYMIRARSLARSDMKAALDALDRAAGFAPEAPEPLLLKADLLASAGRTVEALAAIDDACRAAPRDARPRVQRAQLLINTNQLDAAIAACEDALGIDPRESWAFVLRARAKAARDPLQGNAALEDVARALEVNPKNPGAYLVRAELLLREGDREAALVATARALELAPGMAQAHAMRARLLLGQGIAHNGTEEVFVGSLSPESAQKALPELAKAIALAPSDVDLRVLRARTYVSLANDPERAQACHALARQDLETALAVAPAERRSDIQARIAQLPSPERSRR